MQDFKSDFIQNTYDNESNNEFNNQLKSIDNSYANRLIAGIRVNVPDSIDYHNTNFRINTYDLKKPLVCPINSQEVLVSSKMRPIRLPDFEPFNTRISRFNEESPFVGTDFIARPYNHNYYRNQFLTPLKEMPKIEMDFNWKPKWIK